MHFLSTLSSYKFRAYVLNPFFPDVDKPCYIAEVVRRAKTRQGVVQRELKSLTEAGIPNVEKREHQNSLN